VTSDHLRADCTRCAGLCCVAPAFAASSDFAVDKPAGQPCTHLAPDFRCGIHGELRERGFPGCTVFDCFGAGQQVVQVTFAGRDRRGSPEIAGPMFSAFAVMRQLHELLWYLADALTRDTARDLHADLERARERTEELTRGDADALAALDVDAHRQEVNVLLLRTSELVRADAPHGTSVRGAGMRGRDLRGADLIGRKLRGADLRGASLRGAYLIGTDLTGADLRAADVIGADLRGADLSAADLTGALFLSRFQVNGANGDAATVLPDSVDRPPHWRPALPLTRIRRL
jgi:uncharacterized protein YjbI with pentapeptide repeats